MGDARLVMEKQLAKGESPNYDVLVIDAFSSDAIPVHLITREALQVYLRHMKADGIVAFHVSNRFLDLIPVVARSTKELGAHAVLVSDDPEDDDANSRSRSDSAIERIVRANSGHVPVPISIVEKPGAEAAEVADGAALLGPSTLGIWRRQRR
mgnify:CR=1 FL=1